MFFPFLCVVASFVKEFVMVFRSNRYFILFRLNRPFLCLKGELGAFSISFYVSMDVRAVFASRFRAYVERDHLRFVRLFAFLSFNVKCGVIRFVVRLSGFLQDGVYFFQFPCTNVGTWPFPKLYTIFWVNVMIVRPLLYYQVFLVGRAYNWIIGEGLQVGGGHQWRGYPRFVR